MKKELYTESGEFYEVEFLEEGTCMICDADGKMFFTNGVGYPGAPLCMRCVFEHILEPSE